ncbi:unnamed protein product [Haemonchus placei]|uniref:Hyaluronidase n=1 Tax=Haemonchus placei TaxID=6290 RepID=A0A0N4VU69_HAEPC|nr:unnamed protein product [Haemonchus placei]
MNITPLLDRYGIVHNTKDAYIGDKVALFYEYKFGRYPYYKDYNLSIPINSGTPQNVTREELDEHITIALLNITDNIKCANSSGLGVVDFEEWRPLYDINSVKKVVYKIAAIELTKKKYPEQTNSSVINKTAIEEYDKSAKEFLLETLSNATNERNKTLWGMYGFPYCNYDAGFLKNSSLPPTLEDYRCKDTYRSFNDRMQYIFNASQALYPSIYLNASTPERNFRYVQAIMAETLRVARNYTPTPLPIYVYSKFEYDPLKKNCSFYTKEDLCSTIVLPYVMGANGIIFWSSSSNMKDRCDIVRNFTNTTLGPFVKEVLNESRVNGTLLPRYNETTILTFNETCSTYLPKIVDFIDSRCPNYTSTAKPITTQNGA